MGGISASTLDSPFHRSNLTPRLPNSRVRPDFRDLDEMPPQRAIAGAAGLQIHRGAARRFQPRRIGFAGGGGARIHLFQIFHRHRRLIRVRTFEIGVEIDRRDAHDLDFGNQLAHLQAPIAQMHVADHAPAIGAVQPLQAVADDGGAQMIAHAIGLAILGPPKSITTVLPLARSAQARIARQHRRRALQRRIGEIQIEKAGTGDLDLGEDADRLSAAPRSSRRWRGDWLWRLWPRPARHCTETAPGRAGRTAAPGRSVSQSPSAANASPGDRATAPPPSRRRHGT